MIGKLIERMRFFRDHRWSPRHMSEYLDGELARDGQQRIERHTRDCRRCRELLGALRAMVAGLGGMRDAREEPGTDVAAAVLAGVHERLDEEASGGGPR